MNPTEIYADFPVTIPGLPLRATTVSFPADMRGMLNEALDRPAAQQPTWPDDEHALSVRAILEQLPPITAAADVDLLRARLNKVALGKAFVLQGGDCAETFASNTQPHIAGLINILNQMAANISLQAETPVVTIARLAGQYAKPRSTGIDSSGLPVYRGDIINSATEVASDRTPDPSRMLLAHAHARSTMRQLGQPSASECFVSHEALLLDYERALLRRYDCGGRRKLYGLSSHFLWIGERTRQIDGAHIAFAEMLANPIGIKIGPATSPALAAQYVERLDPDGEPGHLTLISRMGSQQIRDVLPPIVEKVTATGHKVVWQCDPMHGNTEISPCGRKTRQFERIVDELCGFFEVHHRLGTHAAGVHLEMTGDDVTECLGGAQGICDQDLAHRYETACDPRLNGHQAVELGNVIASVASYARTVARV